METNEMVAALVTIEVYQGDRAKWTWRAMELGDPVAQSTVTYARDHAAVAAVRNLFGTAVPIKMVRL